MKTAKMFRATIPALVAFLAASAASAQTVGFAQVIDRLASACGRDIDAHCRKVNLGGGRVMFCLRQNQAKISAQCRTTMAQVMDNVERRQTARLSVPKVCDADIQRLCRGVVAGDGNLLECMVTARRGASDACNQAITEAGYR